MLSSKNNCTYYKTYAKEHVCLYSLEYMINHNENKMKMKNRSHRYDINRPRHGQEHSKYKNRLSMMMLICITKQLSNI